MTNYINFRERVFPTDLLFRNLFDTMSDFTTAVDAKINHPVDIIEVDNGLWFHFAVPGIEKSNIEIEVERGDTLRITYNKPKCKCKSKQETCAMENCNCEHKNYVIRNISKRSFNLAWRISAKYDLNKLDAEMFLGLLKIFIPLVPEAKTQIIKIK